jgi:gluconate kinase
MIYNDLNKEKPKTMYIDLSVNLPLLSSKPIHRYAESYEAKALGIKVANNVESGKSVVLDFCPWKNTKRDEYREWVQSIGTDAQIYYFDVDHQILQKRLAKRNVDTKSAQYVDDTMLEDFIAQFDIPSSKKFTLFKMKNSRLFHF